MRERQGMTHPMGASVSIIMSAKTGPDSRKLGPAKRAGTERTVQGARIARTRIKARGQFTRMVKSLWMTLPGSTESARL